ncbi:uncharacterized protein LOC118648678 [Monomorium pharaonis]|uniref:uncharacterized protein LOC105828953 n=1 Tax=Monomorium pharaonis TaxID=307658 RepID=UPI00063ED470|nr:uncharacterized protein LOC105828953 [Monomorium pharaonis]XP_036150951.1 uncharacterized protein LOC118648678 [Monomorium pharaonis]
MYVDKVLLTIVLCATSAWCSDRTLTRNARTFDTSLFFTWPQTLFSNRPDISIIPKFWPNRLQIQEWTKNGIISLLRLVSFINMEHEPMHIEFKPEDGPRAAKTYQQRFGYRGEYLIQHLGNGLGPNIRLNRQPVFSTFSMSPPIPFKRSNNLKCNSVSDI